MIELDQYEIIERIGEGAFAEVFKAKQTLSDRVVAIKLLSSARFSDERSLHRFQHEAQITASLAHPNIVRIYAFGISSGRPYIVLEYLSGRLLSEVLQDKQPLALERFYRIFKDICAALEHAHSCGLLHRDLKPNNIMLVEDESANESAKILDFGVARFLDESESGKTTQTGQIIGSPAYMSPEQCRGEKGDTRSEIYSLGCVMYECFSGTPPFTGETSQALLLQHLYEAPKNVSMKAAEQKLPPSLEKIIMNCLSKNPDERPQTIRELSERLSSAEKEKTTGLSRLRLGKVALTVVLLAAFCVPIYTILKPNPAVEQKKQCDKTANEWFAANQYQSMLEAADRKKEAGQFEAAIQLYKQLRMRITRDISQDKSIKVAAKRSANRILYKTLTGLADCQRSYGDVELLDTHKQRSELAKVLYGTHGTEYAEALYWTACFLSYAEAKYLTEAEKYCNDSLEIYKSKVGIYSSNSMKVILEPKEREHLISRELKCMMLLGDIYRRQMRLKEAITVLQATVDGYCGFADNDEPDLLWAREKLCCSLYFNKQHSEADREARELIKAIRAVTKLSSAERAEPLQALITCLESSDLKRASKFSAELISILENSSPCPRELAIAQVSLAEIRFRNGDKSAAKESARKALNALKDYKGVESSKLWMNLSSLYSRLGELDSSEYCQKKSAELQNWK